MLKTIVIIFLFITSIIFIFQNQLIFVHTFPINFDMEIFDIDSNNISNSVIILSSFALGSLITLVLIGDSLIRKSLKNNELKKKIISMEENNISSGDTL